ncbi:MAG: hypothetical protein ACO38P_11190, partial [Phycisphaerales bacterium]
MKKLANGLDPTKASAGVRGTHSGSRHANAGILEVRERSAIGEKREHSAKDAPHQGWREVVERQAADDEVVGAGEIGLFD